MILRLIGDRGLGAGERQAPERDGRGQGQTPGRGANGTERDSRLCFQVVFFLCGLRSSSQLNNLSKLERGDAEHPFQWQYRSRAHVHPGSLEYHLHAVPLDQLQGFRI